MDNVFPVSTWEPTQPPGPGLLGDRDRTEEELLALFSLLKWQTQHLYRRPYDPTRWMERAKTLGELQYPELMMGDAVKALTLAQTHELKATTILKERSGWRLGHGCGFYMCVTHDFEQDEQALKEQEEQFFELSGCAQLLQGASMSKMPKMEEGTYVRRAYPWMETRHRERGDSLIAQVNEEMEANRHGEPATCHVQRHAFGVDTTDATKTHDILGVFASRDIQADETIITERASIWGCIGSEENGSGDIMYGGPGCTNHNHPNSVDDPWPAASNYDPIDLRFVRENTGRDASSVLMLVRTLLHTITDGVAHPLDHPLIARATATYRKDHVVDFTYAADFQAPLVILSTAGIDMFANPHFDTWVLFTIQARLATNACGTPISDMMAPLFSFFNHSCRPNCEWLTNRYDHRTIQVVAVKDVREGEQLFITYDGFVMDEALDARRARLWKWLQAPCRCERCVLEESIDKMLMVEYWRMKGGKGGKGGEGGEGGSGRADEKMERWDVPEGELPVFPEDSP